LSNEITTREIELKAFLLSKELYGSGVF